MKLDIRKIRADIGAALNAASKKRIVDKYIEDCAAAIKKHFTGDPEYTADEIRDLEAELVDLHDVSFADRKKEIASFPDPVTKFKEMAKFIEELNNDITINKDLKGYTSAEITKFISELVRLRTDYVDTIKDSIRLAPSTADKVRNATIASADLDKIINDFKSSINPMGFSTTEITALESLKTTLDSFTSTRTTSSSRTTTPVPVPPKLYDTLESIEKNFTSSIFSRNIDDIINYDTKFEEEILNIRKIYMGHPVVEAELKKREADHEFIYTFFSNGYAPGIDTKTMLGDVDMTVSEIMTLLGKDKKTGKDYIELETKTNEFYDKYVSCKSYILSNKDINYKFDLARLEKYKVQCDKSKKELNKQKKHSVIDKRRLLFKYIGAPLNLSIKLLIENFTTAFPEAKGVNAKISKFDLNDYASKHFKFLKYEEDYTNLEKGKAYWDTYKGLSKIEQIDKFMVDSDVINKTFGNLKRLFDTANNFTYGMVAGMVGIPGKVKG